LESLEVDEIDRSILETLQENGRQKHNELARRLKIAQSTVSERVRRMEAQGIIKGYRAILDPQELGFDVSAFISLSLGRHEKAAIKEFEEQIHGIPQIRACYHITGRYDYMLHVVAADLDQLGQLVKNVIAELTGLVSTETFVIFGATKSDAGLPLTGAYQHIIKAG
jgi:Lrp/AsnC family leucine-responsive transcriptional regulator